METLKKVVYWFNALALSVSYLFFSLISAFYSFSAFSLPYKFAHFINSVLKVKPIGIIFDFAESLVSEKYMGFPIYIALLFSLIVSILTALFLRKSLPNLLTCLLSFNFVIPILAFVLLGVSDFIDSLWLLGYIMLAVLSLLTLAYLIITVVLMIKNAGELD